MTPREENRYVSSAKFPGHKKETPRVVHVRVEDTDSDSPRLEEQDL